MIETSEHSRGPLFLANRRTATVGYFIAFILLGTAASFIGPIIPLLTERVGTTLAAISYIFPARSLGYLAGVLFAGRAYDRSLGHPLIAMAVLLLTLMMGIFPFVGSIYPLLFVMLLLGVAESFIDIGGNTLLPWQYEENVSPFMNGLHFCFGAGSFVAPLIIGVLLVNDSSLNWFFWGFAIISLPTAFLIFRTVSPPVRKIENHTGSRSFPWFMVLPMAVMFFLYVGAEMGYGGWISTYATSMNLGDPANAAYLTSAFWGSLTLGRLLSIPLAARTRPTNILIGSFFGSLASMAIFFLFPIEPLGTWIATIGIGLSLSAVFPTIIAFAEVNHKITGKMNSVFFVGVSLGGMVVPWLMGQMFDKTGPNGAMSMVVLASLLLLGVFVVLQNLLKQKGQA